MHDFFYYFGPALNRCRIPYYRGDTQFLHDVFQEGSVAATGCNDLGRAGLSPSYQLPDYVKSAYARKLQLDDGKCDFVLQKFEVVERFLSVLGVQQRILCGCQLFPEGGQELIASVGYEDKIGSHVP